MKNKMGIGHRFAYSFYDFSAYKEFLSQGLFKAIFYCILVTLFFSTLGNIKLADVANDDLSRIENVFVKESPQFEYSNGQLTMDYDKPIYYKFKGESILLKNISTNLLGDVLVVDTTGSTNPTVLDSYGSGIYINTDSITVKALSATESLKLAQLFPYTLDKDSVSMMILIFKYSFIFALLIVNPIISIIANLCAVFVILAPIAMYISRKNNIQLNYKKSCILCFYSMTLPIIIESLITVSGFSIPYYGIIFYFITVLYVSLAINNFKNNNIEIYV